MLKDMTIPSPDAKERVRRIIAGYVLEAPENQLPDFADLRIFDEPLIGVADGDDEIFRTLRRAVSPDHILPRELLEKRASPEAGLGAIRVISWALPFSAEVRHANRGNEWPAELYSVARNNGGALNWRLAGQLVDRLRRNGWSAVCPMLEAEYDAFRSSEHVFSSTWSERHIAFAAALGVFGLNGMLITSRGTMVRLGSLVTDLPLPPTERKSGDHRAPCLQDGGRECGICLNRCPVGAVSSGGLDKEKCYGRRRTIRERFLGTYAQRFRLIAAPIVRSGEREPGFSLGCALCAAAVPCEGAWPSADNQV